MDTTTSQIPIIDLWGQLLVALQGDIRDSQVDELERRLLTHIREGGADGLVLDCSGVWMMDSHLCATLGRLAAAARLMGVRPVLCGLGPAVVMTLQTMGIELEGIETALGLEGALEKLGLEIVRHAPETNEERKEEVEA
jgi:rsbT antagonist protein RsbS